MLIDTHCHLDAREFADDRDSVVRAARTAGVGAIVVPAIAHGNFGAVRDCCRRFLECYPAYGIHPLYIGSADAQSLVVLRDWLSSEGGGDHPPVAVGEIGLDFYYSETDAVRQEEIFVEQLKIARDLDLPVLLHVRRAVDQVLKCLRRIEVRCGIAHAFNGSRQQADEFIRRGFKLGFGGAMTFSGSTRIRKLASSLPLESIVLETDAPDIPPAWLVNTQKTARNTPAELPAIADVLAQLRGLTSAEVAAATAANACAVLALPSPAAVSASSSEQQ